LAQAVQLSGKWPPPEHTPDTILLPCHRDSVSACGGPRYAMGHGHVRSTRVVVSLTGSLPPSWCGAQEGLAKAASRAQPVGDFTRCVANNSLHARPEWCQKWHGMDNSTSTGRLLPCCFSMRSLALQHPTCTHLTIRLIVSVSNSRPTAWPARPPIIETGILHQRPRQVSTHALQ